MNDMEQKEQQKSAHPSISSRIRIWFNENTVHLCLFSVIALNWIYTYFHFTGKGLDTILFNLFTGLICFIYVVYTYKNLFLKVWDSALGKIVYALTAAFVVAFSQAVSSQYIRVTLQTNPDQFPDTQHIFSVLYVVIYTVGVVAIFSMLITAIRTVVFFGQMLSSVLFSTARVKFKDFVDLAASLFAAFFLAMFTPSVSVLSHEIGWDRTFSQEELLVWLSFVKNGRGSELFCSNLPPDTMVSPASPDDVVPNYVLTARRNPPAQAGLKRFSYILDECENTNDPKNIQRK